MDTYRQLRSVLFWLDPETAHNLVIHGLLCAGRPSAVLRVVFGAQVTDAACEVCGIRFPNPVGLAAGMDKNGVALPASWTPGVRAAASPPAQRWCSSTPVSCIAARP